MDYTLNNHFKAKNGFMNDPNGLIFYKGYYHVFFQNDPNNETIKDPAVWGHAITKDFVNWEELPIALSPAAEFEKDGCWSGTAIEKDGILYLMYTSVVYEGYEGEDTPKQSISVAYSEDGINFKRYENNPVISEYPDFVGVDFRDPAVMKYKENDYRLVIASANDGRTKGYLLLYKSTDLFNWEYVGILKEFENVRFCECPSFVNLGDTYFLSTSAADDKKIYSYMMFGDFDGEKFTEKCIGNPQKGPDQYAGQAFTDDKGRLLILSWISGWHFSGVFEKSIGCMSVPMEIKCENGKIKIYPADEAKNLIKNSDPSVLVTENKIEVKRELKEDIIHETKINDISIIRDNYVLEIFINGGEETVTVILC